MHMEYILARYPTIGQPEIDTFTSNTAYAHCLCHLLSYLEQKSTNIRLQLR